MVILIYVRHIEWGSEFVVPITSLNQWKILVTQSLLSKASQAEECQQLGNGSSHLHMAKKASQVHNAKPEASSSLERLG